MISNNVNNKIFCSKKGALFNLDTKFVTSAYTRISFKEKKIHMVCQELQLKLRWPPPSTQEAVGFIPLLIGFVVFLKEETFDLNKFFGYQVSCYLHELDGEYITDRHLIQILASLNKLVKRRTGRRTFMFVLIIHRFVILGYCLSKMTILPKCIS